MIRFEQVTITYADAPAPALHDLDLSIAEGELCVVVGRTGSGKTTFLGAINGLVPHFTGGHLAGRVTVDGRDTRTHPPRELADVVGMVGQDPLAGFVTDTVEEELAYAMEQLAVPAAVMRKRVEETLDLLGIAELRNRALRTLSGGQQQRVAIGSVLTTHPRVLVLDEPTSALDPTAAEDVLAAITRLVHDLGLTVLLAEHRLERVVPFADTLVVLDGRGGLRSGVPADLLTDSPVAPPLVELGRAAGWQPLPLTVRDARRRANGLRERLGTPPADEAESTTAGGLEARGITVTHGSTLAVHDVSLRLRPGTVTALMGRNGSGKSSLLWTLQGSGKRRAGTVTVDGRDPAALDDEVRRTLVGLVPQTAADLLYLETVAEELAASGATAAQLERLVPGIDGETHPRDLSEGQRLALALTLVLAGAPPVLLLDEPTRGLDYAVKHALAEILGGMAADGRAVLVATHDVEFVAQVAGHVVVLAEGQVVSSGPVRRVVAESPAFAPQVTKVLGAPWLRVDEVVARL